MTRHEKLLENYEDALFALLMDEVAEQEGKRFLAENEQLKQNKKSAIPAEVDKRCLKTPCLSHRAGLLALPLVQAC